MPGYLFCSSTTALDNLLSFTDVRKRLFPFPAKISAIAYPNPLEAPVIMMFINDQFSNDKQVNPNVKIVNCKLRP
jgi:hypothetical protein